MAKPLRTETLTRAQANQRLAEMGASRYPTNDGSYTYYSSSHNLWIVATAQQGGYLFEYHRACPCG